MSDGPQHVSYCLSFPRGAGPDQAVSAIRSLTGLLPPWWRRLFTPTVTFEVIAGMGRIEHVLTVPAGRREYVLGALRATIPGLRIRQTERRGLEGLVLARELRCIGSGPLRTDAAAVTNTGVLAALQPLRAGEGLIVQLVVAPIGAPLLPSLRSILEAPDRPPEGTPPPSEPEFAVGLRLGVAAPDAGRTRELAARLLGPFHSLRTPEARLGRRLLPSWLVAARISRAARPDYGAVVVAADELAALAGLPLEGPQLPGLTLIGSRELPVVVSVPERGLVLGDSTVTGAGRPVAIALAEARRGFHLCAPTGAGKTTVLANLARQLMAAGHGLVLIDSKGDLAEAVADRVPDARRNDALVFDPAEPRPVGFNLIGGAEESELIVDHVVGQLRARYGAAGLGPRSEDIARSALLTLSAEPGLTLCEVEPLLTNAGFRQRLIGRLDEPVLESFWGWFGSLSEAARAEAVAPLANKLRTYTLRRRLRTVIGQSWGLDFSRALAEGQVVIVSLAKGLIGEDAASLIGAAMTARLWAAIQGRAGLPEAACPPAMVICDEFQDFASLPLSFGDAVAQSRGYNAGWLLAHQHLAQLDTATRQAVLANCRTRMVMQTTAADAATFAREFAPLLEPADLQSLPAFEGYAAVSTGAAVAPAASIRTRPLPPALGSAKTVRASSSERYGHSSAEVDAAIRARVGGTRPASPVGGVRRAG